MQHVAARAMSIGEHVIAAGEAIDDAVIAILPRGRLERLVAGGWIVQRADLVTQAVEQLFTRLEALEAQVAELAAARRRIRKED